MIVDSHCHASKDWYEPVESLLFQMDRHGVERAVLIQMLGETDNRYLHECRLRCPDRLDIVVLIDANAHDACAQVRHWAEAGAAGIRLRPSARSPGDEPLAIWRAAEASGLAVSCVGSGATFAAPEFADLLSAVPGLRVVLEHLGGTSSPDATPDELTNRRLVFGYARFPNVFLKVPGLGELAPRLRGLAPGLPPFEPMPPTVLSEALEQFGPARLMWGSDYPPVAAREGYGNSLQWVSDALGALPTAARTQIFGGVARAVFSARAA